jgi:hypothetical protein
VFFDQLLSCGLNYTYTWPYDVATRSVLLFRPRHVASINVAASYHEFSFGSDMRYISRVDAIDEDLVRLAPILDGDVRVPTYVVDVRVSRRCDAFGVPVKINFQVNNVLKYSYVELMGNLSPIRSFVLSLEGAL